MTTASIQRQDALAKSMLEGEDTAAEASALHERLVEYVRALSGGGDTRAGVWGEHSYARARGGHERSATNVRVLLAPLPVPDPAPDAPLDVLRPEPRPEPPGDRSHSDSEPEPESGDEEDWEARVAALAPDAAHARLAAESADALRRLRLARLAGAGAGAARAAARRLRLALAAGGGRGAAWLHATLTARLPRGARALYDAAVAELARAAPTAATRLTGVRPVRECGPAPAVRAAWPGPWLVWAGATRWERRMRALVHTRVLRAARPAAAPPEAWCAGAAGALGAALADVLAEAGDRLVFLCGAGGDAALCCALAAGAGAGVGAGAGAGSVRGLVLLAPPLLTAEGSRDAPDDPLAEIRVPMLVVAGTGAAASWRGAARELCAAASGGHARRLLEVRGADDALRLSGATRARLRLQQAALDAAVAEECARWAYEMAEAPAPEEAGAGAGTAAGGERPRRRAPVAAPAPASAAAPDEEFAHLPPPPADARVVSRGTGGTPLPLAPPRRAHVAASAPAPGAAPAPAPAGTAPRLAAADIMQLPIVFVDDEPAADEGEPGGACAAGGGALTVTSGDSRAGGGRRFTRVIVAKRGAGAGAGAGGALVLRRPLRLAAPRHL